MKKVKGYKAQFMSRRKMLSRGFTAYRHNFDINVGRAALE
jgi:hypothetical protein